MRFEEAPRWEWDFGTRKRLHPSMTFTRASAAYFWDDSENLVKRSEINEPSFLDSGILINAAIANRCLQNRNFNESDWTKSNTAGPMSPITGIDGEDCYASLTATSTDATCLQTASYTSGVYWQVSFFVKRLSGSGALHVTLDGGATWTEVEVTGEYARRVFFKTDTTTTSITFGFKISDSGDSFAIDMCECCTAGTTAATAWRPSRPTPTTTTLVTPSYDLLSFDLEHSGLNTAEGTIIVEAKYGTQHRPIGLAPWTNNRVIGLNSSSTDYIIIGNEGPGYNKACLRVAISSVDQCRIEGSQFAESDAYPSGYGTRRIGIAWKSNDFVIIDDGLNEVVSDTSGTIPSITTIGIGSSMPSGTGTFCGTIRYIKYFDRRLPNEKLKQLTRTTTEI